MSIPEAYKKRVYRFIASDKKYALEYLQLNYLGSFLYSNQLITYDLFCETHDALQVPFLNKQLIPLGKEY